ncbi:uncharacterized protein N7487_009106 [Penicillium crustosum]|uniref:uncharacterized protein n=1 Tax=Penicillium crustosum TaxID=36656 RepID=UPI00238F070D|nr:uncharacterized protein N7487_009106 [Penicillium crustosum]KAJ5394803.1 hypothetical protein N7487_009106 [Penicillium crustosum]
MSPESHSESLGDSEFGNGNKSRKLNMSYSWLEKALSRGSKIVVVFWTRPLLREVRSLLIAFNTTVAPGSLA